MQSRLPLFGLSVLPEPHARPAAVLDAGELEPFGSARVAL